jgi:hypothetical protein
LTVVLYAVTDADGPAPEEPGLEGRRLRRLDEPPLGALVSDQTLPSGDEAQAHYAFESVLERLVCTTAAIVPARFGTVASDDEQIREMLAGRRNELVAALERVRGAVELAVHLDGSEQFSPLASSGAAFRRHLRRRRRREAFEAATAGLFRERTEVAGSSTGYLVEADHVERFRAAASETGAWVTGPMAPFSFVE